MDKHLFSVLDYYAVFNYAPTFQQIHTFYGSRIDIAKLTKLLQKHVKSGILVEGNIEDQRVYAFSHSSKFIKLRNTRYKYSELYYRKAIKIAKIIGALPQVQMVGLTGSVAVDNAVKSDDIDFFIISKKDQMWTCRLLVLILLQVMGVRRGIGEKKVAGKICCNLIFDERELLVPITKQSYYTAHEVIQMKSLLSKSNCYKKFIRANKWIYDYFPNATHVIPVDAGINQCHPRLDLGSINIDSGSIDRNDKIKVKTTSVLGWLSFLSIFDKLFRKIQLTLINRHKTIETITDTQLWFFPQDISRISKLKKFV